MAVVGAGPAGLAVSRELARVGVAHIVLERGQIGSSWRTQRWDSFRLNTPRWMNRIPGEFLAGEPESFATASSLISALERFADGLPVHEGVDVLRAQPARGRWRLETAHGSLIADDVVVASGFQNIPRTPQFAAQVPAAVTQLHVADYRRASDLDGPVLVVGGGQSGVQVAEDLLDGGQRVYLATSRVGRMPRRYHGRDGFEWLHDAGQLDLATEHADPAVVGGALPQISGASGGRTVSLQRLAERGATLLGRASGLDGHRLMLAPDLGSNVWFADQVSGMFRATWDRQAGLANSRLDPADEPAEHLYGLTGPESLDLAATGISTIVWTTGFGPSIDWLPVGALDARGRSRIPHLHTIGAPWLTHKLSNGLYGMATDAEAVVSSLTAAELRAAA